jgi:hypothetical protein
MLDRNLVGKRPERTSRLRFIRALTALTERSPSDVALLRESMNGEAGSRR